jgi:hypothetical protein
LKTGKCANPAERGAVRARCIGLPQLGHRGTIVAHSPPDRMNSVASIAHLYALLNGRLKFKHLFET